MLTRRGFVSWLSGLGAVLGLGLRTRPAEARQAEKGFAEQGGGLDTAMVTRLGEAILPGELGDAGVTRVARGFAQWIAGYRAGAELNHPYGSTTIRQTGASPVARWRGQLLALDRQARNQHRRSFAALTRDQRLAMVAGVLGETRGARLPDAISAEHVALALLSWYFASPDATDLCYQSRIGRNQCRPLVNVSRPPLPLAGSGRGDEP